MVNEAEWNLIVPDRVTIRAIHMPLHLDTSSDAGKAVFHADVERVSLDLAEAVADAIAYGCSAGSMVRSISELCDCMKSASTSVTIIFTFSSPTVSLAIIWLACCRAFSKQMLIPGYAFAKGIFVNTANVIVAVMLVGREFITRRNGTVAATSSEYP